MREDRARSGQAGVSRLVRRTPHQCACSPVFSCTIKCHVWGRSIVRYQLLRCVCFSELPDSGRRASAHSGFRVIIITCELVVVCVFFWSGSSQRRCDDTRLSSGGIHCYSADDLSTTTRCEQRQHVYVPRSWLHIRAVGRKCIGIKIKTRCKTNGGVCWKACPSPNGAER